MPSLINYLQQPNGDVISKAADKENDRSITSSSNGSSFLTSITGIRKWEEFNIDTVEACYGKILHSELPQHLPRIQPAVTQMEAQIWDETCLTILFARTIMAQVTAALHESYKYCYGDKEDPIEIRPGGFAKIQHNNSFQADWAGVRSSVVQPNYRSYWNLCPGIVKVASKWKSGDNHATGWEEPWSQIQTCCGVYWRTRYGYVLTDEELVVVRVRAAETAGANAPAFAPLEFRRIAYSAHGKGRMTVKLALWFLHMIASAPGTETVIKCFYLPLHSYIKLKSGGCRHSSTGLGKTILPKDAAVYDPASTSHAVDDPAARERERAEIHASEVYCEDVRKVKWIKEEQQWLIKTFQHGSGYYIPGTPRFRSKKDGRWYHLRHNRSDEYDWILDG